MRFLLCGQPHAGADGQRAEVLFRRLAGDLQHIRPEAQGRTCRTARGLAAARTCGSGSATAARRAVRNLGSISPLQTGSSAMRASAGALAKPLQQRLDVHLAAPGLNLVAGGVKGLGGVGSGGVGLGLDDKLHHHAQLRIVHQQGQGLERGLCWPSRIPPAPAPPISGQRPCRRDRPGRGRTPPALPVWRRAGAGAAFRSDCRAAVGPAPTGRPFVPRRSRRRRLRPAAGPSWHRPECRGR